MLVNRFKQHSCQLMGFQQATKSQQGGGIWCRLTAQVDADKPTNGLAVVDGIFGTFIGETKTLLHDIHAQHARQPDRRAPALACGVAIEWSHLRLELRPGHQLFKVSQEAVATSLLFLAGVLEFGEGLLHARNRLTERGWLKMLSVPRHYGYERRQPCYIKQSYTAATLGLPTKKRWWGRISCEIRCLPKTGHLGIVEMVAVHFRGAKRNGHERTAARDAGARADGVRRNDVQA